MSERVDWEGVLFLGDVVELWFVGLTSPGKVKVVYLNHKGNAIGYTCDDGSEVVYTSLSDITSVKKPIKATQKELEGPGFVPGTCPG